MEETVYLNGELMPRSQARISVYDQGFLYGYGLFETMRAYNGAIFRLDLHIRRLKEAAAQIGISTAIATMDLAGACRETLRANGLTDARLRLTVTRGEADFPGHYGEGTPTVLVTARPYHALAESVYESGWRAGISSYRRGQALAGVKSSSYLVNVLARMEVEAAGWNEALLLNEHGYIAEGSTSNVFFVRDSCLVMPSLESAILPGITREAVIELAASLGIAVSKREIRLEEVSGFQEAFVTNSIIEIMPLVEIINGSQKIIIGQGRPGEITKRFLAAYRELVRKEVD